MCIKSVKSAQDRIHCELLDNEVILWEGSPDRPTLYRQLKSFCYRNLAFALIALAGVAAAVYFKPDYAKSIIILLSGAALLRAIGAMVAWPQMTRRWNVAYALTDRRLILADGRKQEVSSWFSPCIDRMRVKSNKRVSTFKLGDSELGFNIELFAILQHQRLSKLLAPYKMSNLAPKTSEASMIETPAKIPASASTAQTRPMNDRIAA